MGAEEPGSSPDAATGARCDPENWVRQHGNSLYRHALWRVRQPAIAEDIVQETFLTAWKSRKRFRGDSSERAWLFGILKNKLFHHYREERSEQSAFNWESLPDPDAEAFQKTGWLQGWWTHQAAPKSWPSPRASLEQAEFWAVFHACSGKLPRMVAEVFIQREIEDTRTEEICRSLGLTANNVWVMLHRARQALRRCLETNWFGRPHGKSGAMALE